MNNFYISKTQRIRMKFGNMDDTAIEIMKMLILQRERSFSFMEVKIHPEHENYQDKGNDKINSLLIKQMPHY